MTNSVTNELANMQNFSKIQEQATEQLRGPNNEMNQDMFLKLMLEQLKYQDPMNPMSNQEFLAQQAQFTQLNEMQKLNESIASNNTVQQCVGLIGKEVTLIDPDDPTKTITGVVTEAVFDKNGSSIKVGDKNYPLGLVTSIKDYVPKPETPETKPDEKPEQLPTDDKKAEQLPATYGAIGEQANFSKIAQAFNYVAQNISKYLK